MKQNRKNTSSNTVVVTRDTLALAAMQSLLVNPELKEMTDKEVAVRAYILADEMVIASKGK